jgi:hypothetical protein
LSSADCAPTGFRLIDLSLIVSRIDLHQEIAGLDALIIIRGDFQDLSRYTAAEPRQVGTDISVIGGLDSGIAGPFVPARCCQRDKAERDKHREKRNRKAAQAGSRR